MGEESNNITAFICALKMMPPVDHPKIENIK